MNLDDKRVEVREADPADAAAVAAFMLRAWKEAGPEGFGFDGRLRPRVFVGKEDVAEALKGPDVATVNAMPVESHEACHIAGSLCIPCLDLMDAMDWFHPDDTLSRHLTALGEYRRVLTYCGSGIAAAVNAMALLMDGHEDVAVYDRSLNEWYGEGLPTMGTGHWDIWQGR